MSMSQAVLLAMIMAIAAIAAASEEDNAHSSAAVPTSPAPTAEPCSCCGLCNIVPGPYMSATGSVSSWSSSPILPPPLPVPAPAPPTPVVNCATALAGLAPCSALLTGRAAGPPPTPQSGCCNGLAAFVASVRAGGPVDGEQRLRCLCPIVHGDVNTVLANLPVDPVRMVFLPVACGVALPAETIPMCFGQHMPTVANFTPVH